MATRPEGHVIERRSKSGLGYAIRFNAYGRRRYVTLGLQVDGWTRSKAEVELANVLADVRRGLWISLAQRKRLRVRKRRMEADTVFGPFARRLVAERGAQLSESTQDYLEWGLSHLLPYFNDWFLRDIDAEAVDEYLSHKLKESSLRRAALEHGKPLRGKDGRPLRPLSASSINKLIDILQWVLSAAEEYGRIERNPARGRRRRLPQDQRPPVYLDSAAQIEALLDAADQLDRAPKTRIKERLPLIATLLFAGLRAGELSAIQWRDLDFSAGKIRVRASKTQAGLREIAMLPILRSLLKEHMMPLVEVEPGDLVFSTRRGTPRDKDNIRVRILSPVVAGADQLLIGRTRSPLPGGVSPHKLRHTFASILIACGEDPASVMYQLGHVDPQFTLRTYVHMMRRESKERDQLKALVESDGWRASEVERFHPLRGSCRGGSRPGSRVPTGVSWGSGVGWAME